MSILTQLTDVDVTALQEVLREHMPTAVWHAKGVRGGYRRQFDPESHQLRAPPELEQYLRDKVYDTPGLYDLLAYRPNEVRFEHQDARVSLSHNEGLTVALFERARRLSLYVLLGVPSSLVDFYRTPAMEHT